MFAIPALILIVCSCVELCAGWKRISHTRYSLWAPLRLTRTLSNEPPIPMLTGAATVLKCASLSKSFTGTPQFSSVSLNLAKGQRMGLIGLNGAGKSTFLKCLAGLEFADSGLVESAAGSNVIYVDQDPDWGNISVFEALFNGPSGAASSTRNYYAFMKNEQAFDNDLFAKLSDAMETCNGWEYQERGLSIAEKLNIPEDYLFRNVATLSGGQRKRVGLAAALLKQPDVLLLDEPTNHLDIDALEWLVDYLRPTNRENKDLTVLLVTHDRYFLEKACSEIIELDRGSLHRYPGNYARYLELKEARIAAEDAEAQRARTKLRKESEWMARQPQARQAKSKAREQQFYELVSKAKGRGSDVKKVELATSEEKEKQQRLGGVVAEFLGADYYMGNADADADPATGTGAATAAPRVPLLRDFTYNFRQRDRIGIVGPNGVGKSTFLKLMAGKLLLSAGTMRLGETVRLGYYKQSGLVLSAQQEASTILKFVQQAVEKGGAQLSNEGVKEAAPQIVVEMGAALGRRKAMAGKESGVSVSVTSASLSGSSVAFSEREAMALLKRFQFPFSRWYDRVSQLSGGERRRLQLLQVLARAPNVLLLDEPSNDLDLGTLTALEEYLCEAFEGCLVVVSHDNFFINRVAEHLFVFEGEGAVRDFQGSYDEYLDYRKEARTMLRMGTSAKKEEQSEGRSAAHASAVSPSSSSTIAVNAAARAKVKGSLTKEQSKEVMRLEREMESLAQEKAQLDQALLEYASAASSSACSNDCTGRDKLVEFDGQIAALEQRLLEKEERWLLLQA